MYLSPVLSSLTDPASTVFVDGMCPDGVSMMPTPENSYDDVGSQPIGTRPLSLIHLFGVKLMSSLPS